MPVKIETSGGLDGQLASFTAAAAGFWANVNRFVVHRLKRSQQTEIAAGRVTHIQGADDEAIERDRNVVIGQFWNIAREDAEKNGPGEYRFAIYGPEILPVRGRSKVTGAPDVELHWQKIRIGEAEPPPDDAGIMNAASTLLKKAAESTIDTGNAIRGAITGYEQLFTLQQAMLTATMSQLTESQARNSQQNEYLFKVTELQINKEAQEREEARQHAREVAIVQAEAQAAAAHQQTLRNMMALAKEFGSKIFFLHMMSKGTPEQQEAARAAARESAGTVHQDRPADETIAAELAEILECTSPAERERLTVCLGDRVWDRIVAASKAPDDDKAIVILHGIMDEMKADPKLLQGLLQAAEILSGARAEKLLELLGRAGVKL